MKNSYLTVTPIPTIALSPELQEEFDCLNAVISKLVDRVQNLEIMLEYKKNQANADLTTLRAILIATKLDEKDYLSRSEVQRILNGCHHNYALKVMKKTTQLYSGICLQKTLRNKWVLRRV